MKGDKKTNSYYWLENRGVTIILIMTEENFDWNKDYLLAYLFYTCFLSSLLA